MARSSSTSKRAELAAQRIFELRETRSDILSGQADNPPADGKAMQLVLDNLAAQEAALTAMFTGVKSASTIVEKVTVTPDSAGVSDKIIARLSAVDGFVAPDNLVSAPVRLTVKLLESGAIPAMENGSPKAFPKGGVAYRIPGRVLVSVEYAWPHHRGAGSGHSPVGSRVRTRSKVIYRQERTFASTIRPGHRSHNRTRLR